MSKEQNIEIATRHVEELWNKQNYDVIDELYSEDFVIQSLWPNPLLPGGQGDREGARKAAAGWLGTFPDMHFTLDHVVADDEKVITVSTCTATDTNGFLGAAPTGKPLEVTGILIHQIQDGKITRLWTMFDLFAGLLQTGKIPGPPPQGAGGPPPR
jgi:steroid delta-isomerase-like uncharacterized protein